MAGLAAIRRVPASTFDSICLTLAAVVCRRLRSGSVLGNGSFTRGFPGPRQQIAEALRGMIGDAGEHVGEPRLGIDVAELCRLDQREHDGGAVAAGVGAAEGPVSSADGDAADGALGGVVRQADAAVVLEARLRVRP